MTTSLLFIALLTGLFTFLGGLFAIKFKDKSHLITSFSAGAVLGLAFFDLLPESIGLVGVENLHLMAFLLAVGFIFYLILDRLFHNHEDLESAHSHTHNDIAEKSERGILRAGLLSLHSFLDGLGIGFAFQVSTTLGFVFAVAVLAHDFSDGINTVSAILKSQKEKVGRNFTALKWLTVDSIAPIFGILVSLFIAIEEKTLGLILAIFTGFFLYIGASDLIPESYHKHPSKITTLMTILGMLFIFTIINLAS